MEELKTDRIDEAKIDLLRLFEEFWKVLPRLFFVPLALAVLFGAALGIYRWRHYTPLYESSVIFTVQLTDAASSDLSGGTGYYDKATAEQMSKTFPYLLQCELMQSKLRSAMGVSALNGSISAQTVDNTNMFTLRVTSPDPQSAYDILTAMIQVYPEVADYVVGRTDMTLLTEPTVASEPYNTFRPIRTICKGACLGLAAGLLLLFLYSLTRKTIRTANDVQKLLNQKCLAVLPRVNLKRREHAERSSVSILNRNISSSFQENVRSLRLKVIKEMQAKDQKVLLVTSTMPGEGKSTVSANLALSLSQNGAKVILVDLDLRKPVVKKILDVKTPSSGVPELLSQHVQDPTPHLVQVENTSLYLLAGDSPAADAYKALNSRALHTMIRTLREQADYVILDTPPSGILADSVSISRAADAALYVLGAELVETAGAMNGLQYLLSGNVRLLGCVLNGARSVHGRYGYSYGYGYGYGYSISGYGHYGSGKHTSRQTGKREGKQKK